jgi:putative endonuclease
VFYVYILRSVNHPAQTYIGSTEDLRARLAQHNAGRSIHTKKFKPWKSKLTWRCRKRNPPIDLKDI